MDDTHSSPLNISRRQASLMQIRKFDEFFADINKKLLKISVQNFCDRIVGLSKSEIKDLYNTSLEDEPLFKELRGILEKFTSNSRIFTRNKTKLQVDFLIALHYYFHQLLFEISTHKE